MPRVTVLMPVYNGELYLREAVDSILNQTFTDFELLVIDDGSSDQSVAIMTSYTDPRVRFLSNGANYGLIFTLNKGLGLARGEYIARMDCDDFSLPDRLARQVEYMDQYPEIGLVGSTIKYMHSEIRIQHPTDHDYIKAALLFYCSLNHPSVMMRKAVMIGYSLSYDYEFPHAEDYELWSRMANVTRIANIPDVLLHYRIHGEQIGAKYNVEQQLRGRRIVYNQLVRMGILPTAEELNFHMDICERRYQPTDAFMNAVRGWFDKLRAVNNATLFNTPQALESVLSAYYAEAEQVYSAARRQLAKPSIGRKKTKVRQRKRMRRALPVTQAPRKKRKKVASAKPLKKVIRKARTAAPKRIVRKKSKKTAS